MTARRLLVLALLLAGTGAAIFAPFLFGPRLLLYQDIGSDSLNIELPLLAHLSDYLRRDGLPRWSFNFGLGQSLSPYISALIFSPVVWLPKTAIPVALAWQHLAKIVLAGLLFFRFLTLRRLPFASAALGALGLACGAYMTFGSCWSIAANEVLAFTFLLFALEQIFARGRWIYLPLAVAGLGCLGAFHLYLGALFLVGYFACREVELHPGNIRAWAKLAGQLAVIAALGAALSAVILLDGTDAILHSPRGSGTSAYAHDLASRPVFALASPRQYLTALSRLFSTDLLGTGSQFRGWNNYFEAPPYYCGLLSLLLLPQIFVRATRRQRLFAATFIALALLPVIFPWFRYLFWSFQGDYYRTLALFTVVGFLTLAATAHARYCRANIFSPLLLLVTALALLGLLWLPRALAPELVAPRVQIAGSLFLAGYAGLLFLGQYFRHRQIFASLVVALTAVELAASARVSVANRPTVNKPELRQRSGYNDHTIEALRAIPRDESGFFRVTKSYSSGPAAHVSLNDALVFGYFGTAAYSSFNHLRYIAFLTALGVLADDAPEIDTRWVYGLAGRPILATFLGEKYFLTHDPIPEMTGGAYELLDRFGPVFLYRNRLALPFGLAFDRAIRMEDLRQLPAESRALALLQAVALPSASLAGGHGLSVMSREELEGALRTTPITESFLRLRDGAFSLRSFRQNDFAGTIDVARPAVLVLQMPCDDGWQASLDGKAVPIFPVDGGLLGIMLPAGEHALALHYAPRFLFLGASLSLAALLILLLGWWRWPRLSVPHGAH